MNNYDQTEWCFCGERFTADEKYCSNCGKERPQKINTKPQSFGQQPQIFNQQSQTFNQSNKDYNTCLSCGREMQHGYIHSQHPMRWKESDSNWFYNTQRINSDASGFHFIGGNQLESFRCPECRIIQIRY